MDSGGIADRLEYWRSADPGAPAIGAVGEAMMTRGELADAMHRGRQALRAAGLGPTDRIAVLLPEGLGSAIATLQVAGACSVAPVRPSLGTAGWTEPLRRLAPDALVVSADWPEAAYAARELGLPVFGPDALGEHAGGDRSTTARCQELLLATSGSTGPPKWVRIPQQRMVAGSRAMARCMDLTPDDIALLSLPLNHAHGVASGLLLPLLSGGSAVVADGFDPEQFLRAVAEHGVTWYSVAPAMHRALLEQHALTPLARGHRLRMVRSGTVALPAATIDALAAEFGVPVIEAYGMTESPHITCNPITAPRQGSVGRAVVEELIVADDDGRPVACGEWGQVMFRGAPVMSGYLDSSADAAVLRDGWVCSGDEGRLDADGYLYLRGRISERINRGGAMVAPAEVDAALLRHPAVRAAVSFAIPHFSLGEDLVAAVTLEPYSEVDESNIRRYLRRRLEPRQIPSRIAVVAAIPVGAAGKVSRGELGRLLAGALQAEYEPPRSPVEAVIVDLFDVLLSSRMPAQEKVGRSTNFFLAGGDSLIAMQLLAGLARQGWGEHPPTLILDHPTPGEMAAALAAECGADRASHLVTLQSEGHLNPVVVVHGFGGQLFGYMALARALAPDRPTLGLQCAGLTAEELSRLGVTELAERYADDILQRDLQGPIHLVGYSAGGWYAYAVAAALHERGARLGMVALLDSHALRHTPAFTQLPRRVRLTFFARRVNARVRTERLSAYLKSVAQRRLSSLRSPDRPNSPPDPDWAEGLLGSYRPPRLPIAVHLFGPEESMMKLSDTWRHYARDGVHCHHMFEEHEDFIRRALAPQLATALESALAEVESDQI